MHLISLGQPLEEPPEEPPPEEQPPEDLRTCRMKIIWIPETKQCMHGEGLEDNNALDLWMTVLRCAPLRWHLLPKLYKISNIFTTFS